MKHLGLFEGIGGFSLAARWAGWHTVAWVEINEFGQADFPASLFPQQESEKEQTMTAICGPKCLEQFERFNRATLWARTFAGLLIGTGEWYSTRCRLIWKLKATKSSRFYFQLAPSTLPTEGTGFGLLPTPLVMDTATNLEKVDERRRKNKERNNGKNGRKRSGNGMGTTLNELLLRRLLPTPAASDNRDRGGAERPRSSKAFRNWKASWSYDDGRWPTQPPVCGRNDGLSPGLDGITISKHRKESIMAYGNAIVPQVARELFKVIDKMK